MNRIILLIAVCTFLFLSAGAQPKSAIYPKDVAGYVLAAKDPRYNCFVAFENGDTLEGTTLKVEKPHSNSPRILLDGKDVNYHANSRVMSMQDEDGFFLMNSFKEKGIWHVDVFNMAARVMRGNIELFCATDRDPRSGGRIFTMRKKGECCGIRAEPPVLGEWIAGNDKAVAKYKELFPADKGSNYRDYLKVIQVLEIYNGLQ